MVRLVIANMILAGVSEPLGAMQYASYAEGKQFVVTIVDKDLLKSPIWRADAANPPLSARRAMRLAEKLRSTLVKDSENYKWELVTAELYRDEHVDRWYWLVTFEARVRHDRERGDTPNLRLIVLMDGTVVKPAVRPYSLK